MNKIIFVLDSHHLHVLVAGLLRVLVLDMVLALKDVEFEVAFVPVVEADGLNDDGFNDCLLLLVISW